MTLNTDTVRTTNRNRRELAMDAGRDTQVDVEMQDAVTATMAALLPGLLEYQGSITPQTRLQEELGLSSSLALELLLGIEEEHAIQIDVELMDEDSLITVADLAEYIAGHYRRI
jgi:acyl carrier protein